MNYQSAPRMNNLLTSATGMELSKLNSATLEDLRKIEQLGQERAEELIKYRDANGDFEGWEDIKKVPGFSEEIVDLLRAGNNDEEGEGIEMEEE